MEARRRRCPAASTLIHTRSMFHPPTTPSKTSPTPHSSGRSRPHSRLKSPGRFIISPLYFILESLRFFPFSSASHSAPPPVSPFQCFPFFSLLPPLLSCLGPFCFSLFHTTPFPNPFLGLFLSFSCLSIFLLSFLPLSPLLI